MLLNPSNDPSADLAKIERVIITPHPDDEVLGLSNSNCMNDKTYIIYFTSGDYGRSKYPDGSYPTDKDAVQKLREVEAVFACKTMGVAGYAFLRASEMNIPTSDINNVHLQAILTYKLLEMPNLKAIYTTHYLDRHAVHKQVGLWISNWFIQFVNQWEIATTTEPPKLFYYSIYPIEWEKTITVELTEKEYETKLKILSECYKSQWDIFLSKAVLKERSEDFKKEIIYVP